MKKLIFILIILTFQVTHANTSIKSLSKKLEIRFLECSFTQNGVSYNLSFWPDDQKISHSLSKKGAAPESHLFDIVNILSPELSHEAFVLQTVKGRGKFNEMIFYNDGTAQLSLASNFSPVFADYVMIKNCRFQF